MNRALIICACSYLALNVFGCKPENTSPLPPAATRSFAMGFTYFPHDGTLSGLTFALTAISNDGDLLVAHFDNGIPWDAALANDFSQYPQDFKDEIAGIVAAKPGGHKLYLAITPIAFLRNRLAPTRGTSGQQTFQPPWDAYPFNHPNVVRAYINHCRIMTNRFHPEYLAFGVEANLLREFTVDSVWNQYVALAKTVYDSLKLSYPSLPMFQTIQAGSYYRNPAIQTAALQQLFSSTDVVAVSAYPYGDFELYHGGDTANPAKLPPTYFSTIAGLAPTKPFAISETAWPAEDVGAPYPITIYSTSSNQKAYVDFLLNATDALNGKFVCWFFTRDYDYFWNTTLHSLPDSALIRLWKDTGLYDGAGNSRPALASWKSYLSRPMR